MRPFPVFGAVAATARPPKDQNRISVPHLSVWAMVLACLAAAPLAGAAKADSRAGAKAEARNEAKNDAKNEECIELVKVHGLLGRAYSQCHFTFYSRGFVIQAEACGSKMGDKIYKQWLAEGTAAFESRASQMGQAALCAKILKDFPYTVRQ